MSLSVRIRKNRVCAWGMENLNMEEAGFGEGGAGWEGSPEREGGAYRLLGGGEPQVSKEGIVGRWFCC